MTYTISVLAKLHGMSRSALLHYDRIGLLNPSARNTAGYRLYSEADEKRLREICVYRDAGMPLEQIARIFTAEGSASARQALATHLHELHERIEELRNQQARVLKLLGSGSLPSRPGSLSRDDMVAVLRGAGLDDEGLDRLHVLFERIDPEAHQVFLEGLGLGPEEVAVVRRNSE